METTTQTSRFRRWSHARVARAALCGTLALGVAPQAIADEDTSTIKRREADQRKMPDAPADPWSWATEDGPKQFNKEYVEQSKDADCSAAHDHCLPPMVWFVEDGERAAINPLWRPLFAGFFINGGLKEGSTSVDPRLFGLTGNVAIESAGLSSKERFVAYRTVPATRALLVKGATVLALDYPTVQPQSEQNALASRWKLGVVKSVDWDNGKVYYVGRTDPYFISATRVAVLRWKVGGKVEVIAKGSADKLTVSAADTFKSIAIKPQTPASQVSATGQPIEDPDRRAFESTSPFACDSDHNHCMRPWTWLAKDESGNTANPVRFVDGKMQYIRRVDHYIPVEGARMAYLTEPATAAKLKPGTKIFYRDTAIVREEQANSEDWHLDTVEEVEPELNLWKAKGETRLRKIGLARIAVLKWFPGEKVAPVK